MPYVVESRGLSGYRGTLGCGGDCPCSSCRSRQRGLGEWYESDKENGLSEPAAVFSAPGYSGASRFSGFGADVSALHPTSAGVRCRASERRIRLRSPMEASASSLITVAEAYRTDRRKAVQVDRTAYEAYVRMKQAAEADGIPANVLTINSGFRSISEQRVIWARAVQKYGSEQAARRWVARPGFSPHHTGRAFDLHLGSSGMSSESAAAGSNTIAYRWLVCNASRFGFTPYAPEPWHWEYNPAAAAPAAVSGWFGEPDSVLTPSEEKAFRFTSEMEGGMGAVAGNFDGMGASVGALQWNIGSGSLQPLLQQFISQEASAFNQIFGNGADQVRQLLTRPRSEQVRFFDSVSAQPNKARLVEPWQTRFRTMALHPAFVALQMRAARSRLSAAYGSMKTFQMNTERALVFMFDTVTQHGNGWLDKPVGTPARPRRALIEERLSRRQSQAGRPLTILEKLEEIAHVLSATSAARWRQNVLCRRMLIVHGVVPSGMTCPQRYRTANLTQQFQVGDQVISLPGEQARGARS